MVSKDIRDTLRDASFKGILLHFWHPGIIVQTLSSLGDLFLHVNGLCLRMY